MNPHDMTTVRVCVDCYMAAANGINDTYAEWPDGFREAWAAAVAREGGRVFDPVIDDSWDGPHGFSWSPCEWCESALGGSRFYGVLPDDSTVTA